MAIEVYNQNGKLIYFEPSFHGEEFKKALEFKKGETYIINVFSSGLKKTFVYDSSNLAKFKDFLIALVVLIIIAAIVILLKKLILKKNQKLV